jgi:hypothetical protein
MAMAEVQVVKIGESTALEFDVDGVMLVSSSGAEMLEPDETVFLTSEQMLLVAGYLLGAVQESRATVYAQGAAVGAVTYLAATHRLSSGLKPGHTAVMDFGDGVRVHEEWLDGVIVRRVELAS